MSKEDIEIINRTIEDYYEYCQTTLSEILRKLPLGDESRKIGIYGAGRHTKLLLTAFKNLIGPIRADLFYISVDFDPYLEICVPDELININDVSKKKLDSIILSSSDYEDELYRALKESLSEEVLSGLEVFRFYDKYQSDIFWQNKQMVRFPDRPFSELPILKFKMDDVFNGSRDIPLSCVMDKYRIQMSEEPDIYIYMCYGNAHKGFHYPCVRVAYWAGESHEPDWNDCDYAVTTRVIEDEPRHHRYNAMEPYNSMIQNRKPFLKKEMADRKFCNFIYSNETYGEGAFLRKEFCKRLMNYKHVDCPGKVLNNMKDAIEPRNGAWSRSKVEFIRNYKFTIAFENESADGYTTEKLFQPLRVGSVPIYWGNPKITDIVDSRCFVNCNEYDNDLDSVIQRVIEIDNDPELYMYMLGISPMKPDYRFDHYDANEAFWIKVIEDNHIFD